MLFYPKMMLSLTEVLNATDFTAKITQESLKLITEKIYEIAKYVTGER